MTGTKQISVQEFQKEVELILLCAQLNSTPKIFSRIKALTQQQIDWSFFDTTIKKNRVATIVYQNLKSEKQNIPPAVISELKNLIIFRSAFNIKTISFLHHLHQKFEEQKISVLPFKGPALSEQVYGDISFRWFSDLDILVDKADALASYHLLLKEGFHPQQKLTDKQFKKYIDNEDHFIFYTGKNGLSVELHWELSGLYLSNPITLSDLRENIQSRTLDGKEILCLSSEALLVYLCIHGCKDGWDYLERICCIHELMKPANNINLQTVQDLSNKWKCKNMVLFGLHLTRIIFNADIPENLRLNLRKNKKLARRAEQLKESYFELMTSTDKTLINRFSLFHFEIRDSLVEKMLFLFKLLFRPTDKEWLYFPVPSKISFVHYLLRPCRLIIMKLRGSHA